MDLKDQNMFGNQIFQKQVDFYQNPALRNTVSNLKAMSLEPNKKNEVLSTLTRFQGQMNPKDYNEILANVKSLNVAASLETEKSLESKKEIREQDYQKTISDLKRLEHEMRFK